MSRYLGFGSTLYVGRQAPSCSSSFALGVKAVRTGGTPRGADHVEEYGASKSGSEGTEGHSFIAACQPARTRASTSRRGHHRPVLLQITAGAVGAWTLAKRRWPQIGRTHVGKAYVRASSAMRSQWSTVTTAAHASLVDGQFQGEFTPTAEPPFLKDRLDIWDRLWAKSQTNVKSKPTTTIEIILPDGSIREGTSWTTTPLDIAESISKRLAANVVSALVEYSDPSVSTLSSSCVAADVDEDELHDEETSDDQSSRPQLWDLTRPLEGNCHLELVKFDDPRGRDVFWHSSSHVLGAALELKFGGLLTIGPAVESGFYYDMFIGDTRLSDSDLKAIEDTVDTVRKDNQPFQRLVLSREEALELFAHNPFKVDLITRKVPPGQKTTAYRCGSLIDLCRGPHLPSTGSVKALSLTKNSSSYWLGSASNVSLQRIYGVAFPSKKELKQHMKMLEEAKERDHRRIGRQQDLFFFNAAVSPGSCFWTTHGARIYNRLCDLMRAEYRARGFHEVITPNIYSSELFKKSGHYQNYRSDMYGFNVEGHEWFLKPMNCPGHCVIFDSKPRSYRELPLRLASFGVLHRNELSGTLSGLTRVRRFQQDDAHIFCKEDQIRDEVSSALKFVFDMYDLFGFEFSLALSTRPKKALGSEELWNRAEAQLRSALNETGRDWILNKGDGAFYGPKIDIRLQDALGRGHQCGTIQLDFQLPLRFNLRYQTEGAEAPADQALIASGETDLENTVCEDSGNELPPGYARPVILHRAILGSVERMVGVLCEHFAGKWPFWLSPRQCIVVPISEDAFEYARYVRNTLHSHGFHTDVNLSDGTLKKKVREAQLAQWNYILVVGASEEANMSVNLRVRGNTKPVGERDLAELIAQLEEENQPRALRRPTSLPLFARKSAGSKTELPIDLSKRADSNEEPAAVH